jgi:hypothetical protein
MPIFRRPERDSEGHLVTHPTLALPYARAQEYEVATSKSAGFKVGLYINIEKEPE